VVVGGGGREKCKKVTVNAYRIVTGKSRVKKQKRRWVGNIKINLRKIGYEDMKWNHVKYVQ